MMRRMKAEEREKNRERIRRQDVESTYFCCGQKRPVMHHWKHLNSVVHRNRMESIRVQSI